MLFFCLFFDILLSMKLIFGPMATLSHQGMRQTIEEFGGCDEYYTEMIQASSYICKGPFESYYVLNGPNPNTIVWQLTGNSKEPIVKAAPLIMEHGGIGIDLNMGCSAPEIVRQGAGIAWMSKPLSETQSLVSSVRKELDINGYSQARLSVKMRLGEENWTLEGFYQFVDMLIGEGVTQLVLHPRTRKEKYSRPAHWEHVENLAQYVHEKHGKTIQVIGNGEIKDVESFVNNTSKAPSADGVMIARYGVQKPWLFSQIAKHLNPTESGNFPKIADLLQVAEHFISFMEQSQPPEFYSTRSRRFFTYYCDNFKYGHYIRSKILNANSNSEMIFLLNQYLTDNIQERFLNL